MTLSVAQKAKVIEDAVQTFSLTDQDTGSPEVQVSILTAEIRDLTEHCTDHKKDVHSRVGLLRKVSKRRKLLDYLKRNSQSRYQALIKHLDLRK